MKFLSYFKYLFLLVLLLSSKNYAQNNSNTATKPARILYLVDVSSSMMYEWEKDEIRMKIVGQLVTAITDSLTHYNNNIDFALRLIGSQYPAQKKICTDTKLEVPFGTLNGKELIKHKANTLKPYGFTPIAYSLQQSAINDFPNSNEYNYSIILITDGGESCNGDICAVMNEMLNKKISFKPYILSLVKDIDLERQYQCMGTYINILEPKDFDLAIKKIINDNKVVFNITNDAVRIKNNQQLTKNNNTSTTQTPIQQPKISTPKTLIDTFKNTTANTPKPTPIVEKPLEQELVIPDVNRLAYNKKLKKYTIILADKRMPRMPAIPMVEVLKPEPYPTVVVIPEATPKPTPQPERPKPTNTVTSKPAAQSSIIEEKSQPKEMMVTNETQPSDKTQLKVRFVTQSGREIFTEPVLTITNKATKNKIVERREVAAGTKAIKPIDLKEGAYTIQVGTSIDYTKDIQILPNQLNTVTIVVNNASLAFQYEGNKDRPMKEYTAYVSNRFSLNRTNTKQPCDTRLPYEPASYHIEVNTMPPSMYFLDLEIGVTKVILIPENGTITFTNTTPLGMIELYYQLGDAYKHFKNMPINGNQNAQSLELLPGNYQVRYTHPTTKKLTTMPFRISSNKTTSIEL